MTRKLLIILPLITGLLAACGARIEDTPLPPQITPVTQAPKVEDTPAPTLPPTLDLGSLDLPGHLIVNHLTDGLLMIDLADGAVTSLFTPVLGSQLTAFSVSPDGTQLVMAYAPPAAEDENTFSYASLFVMPLDGSTPPEPYLPGNDQEGFFSPAWAPDGMIYFGHFRRSEFTDTSSGYQLERAAYPETSQEGLLDDALWPDFPSDSTQMVYIQFNRETFIDDLFIANTDGSDARPLIEQGLFEAVDVPRFSPDGTQVLFSAVASEHVESRSLWGRLSGVAVARAHSDPSELWIVSAEGGEPQQLTDLAVLGLNADFSPDGEHIAFVSAEGLSVMNSDGSDLQQVLANPAFAYIQWIP